MGRSAFLLIAGLCLAACGGGNEASIVSVANVDGTQVLADSAGKTLYSAAAESGGKILCVDSCTSFWAPALASAADAKAAGSEVGANLGVTTRPDGKQQLTFKGAPLYTFAKEGAGALKGDGASDDFAGTHFQWQAARTSGAAPSKPQGGYGSGY